MQLKCNTFIFKESAKLDVYYQVIKIVLPHRGLNKHICQDKPLAYGARLDRKVNRGWVTYIPIRLSLWKKKEEKK